jgi:hypothetical protein
VLPLAAASRGARGGCANTDERRRKMPTDVRAYWQICGEQLIKLAQAEVGPRATAAQLRDALQHARRRRPDLAAAYDAKRLSHADEEGVLHYVVDGLEIEIPTRRTAEIRLARRVNQLTKSGEAKSALEALEIARREAPALAELLDGR